MRIYSNNVKNSEFDKNIGHLGDEVYKGTMPTRSFHLAWEDLPENTESLALIFIDHDAIPACGFSWIHWTVANIDPKKGELQENESIEGDLLEGVNSWGSGIVPDNFRLSSEEAIGFGGCAPPDQTHSYTIEVYALDKSLDLHRGFFMNELLKVMQGHILDKAELTAVYHNK